MSLGFVREFLKSPTSVGAIWPSSPSLAKVMVRASQVRQAESVLELGAGSGAFTGEILRALCPEARFIAIEKSPDLVKAISTKFPHAKVITGCASRLTQHLQEQQFEKPHVILSGLPWAAFKLELQATILNEVAAALADDGIFSTFAYYGPHWLKAGRVFRRSLTEIFSDVRQSPVVLANLPPAFVYSCRR